MSVHRLLSGGWGECSNPEGCELLFHVALNVAEAEALPLMALLQLFEIAQPPSRISHGGVKEWEDELGDAHRAYDLPAVIYPEGTMEWWHHGEMHRERGPARIFQDGTLEWWSGDQLHREDGPARVGLTESEWWWKGVRFFRPEFMPQWQPYLTGDGAVD